jgi:hypothetical protein
MARANYRIAVVFPSSLWVNTLDETAHVSDIALTGNWSLTNRHIMAVLRAVTPENSGGEIRALVIGRTSGRYRQETWRCIWSRNRVPLPDERMGKRTIV